jgi:hypothetical protein
MVGIALQPCSLFLFLADRTSHLILRLVSVRKHPPVNPRRRGFIRRGCTHNIGRGDATFLMIISAPLLPLFGLKRIANRELLWHRIFA